MVPTVEEFLCFTPRRMDFTWDTDEAGLVRVTVPKFQGKLGDSFCKLIRKGTTFTANLDKLGSLVWKQCDGKTTVQQILKLLQKEYAKEENIDQRLFLFLQQMHNLGYIAY